MEYQLVESWLNGDAAFGAPISVDTLVLYIRYLREPAEKALGICSIGVDNPQSVVCRGLGYESMRMAQKAIGYFHRKLWTASTAKGCPSATRSTSTTRESRRSSSKAR